LKQYTVMSAAPTAYLTSAGPGSPDCRLKGRVQAHWTGRRWRLRAAAYSVHSTIMETVSHCAVYCVTLCGVLCHIVRCTVSPCRANGGAVGPRGLDWLRAMNLDYFLKLRMSPLFLASWHISWSLGICPGLLAF
jgi:hypothetical protein